ncbi:MAG: adenylate kinase [Acidobacteria bacterium]|nr:MAG: adenylate kinase [Acidobacteriota bacterium]
MRLVFLGPPGVGKGTQAERIRAELDIPHLSAGDMLREAVRRGTEGGRKARAIMERGELVPDALIGEMIAEKLRALEGTKGFLLDGYPRNTAQVEALDAVLASLNARLDKALLLVAPEEEILRRLTLRRSCPSCGAVYHLAHRPPRGVGVCDACGARLVQRSDDTEEVVRSRLAVYRRQTAPIVEIYRRRGILAEVDGIGSADEVAARIRRALQDAAA